MALLDAEGLRRCGEVWRTALRGNRPHDLRPYPPLSPPPGSRRALAADGVQAIFTKALYPPERFGRPAMTRAITLRLLFHAPRAAGDEGHPIWLPHDFGRAAALCHGAFGEHVEKVIVAPPTTPWQRERDAHDWMLFVEKGWEIPVPGVVAPPGHLGFVEAIFVAGVAGLRAAR